MTALSTFGSPLSDIELWRCAKQQLDLHGEIAAIIEANERMYDLDAAGDRDGANTWMAIVLRILHLSTGRSEGSLH